MVTSFPAIIELGLGLILVYYIASLIVSSITGWFLELLDSRAKDLEDGLIELLGEGFSGINEAQTKKIVDRLFDELYQSPLLKSLTPMYTSFLKRIGKWFSFLPGINHSIFGTQEIPAELFAKAIADVLKNKVDEETRSLIKEPYFLDLLEKAEAGATSTVKEIGAWFDGKMQEVGKLYEVHARRIAATVALIVVVVLNLDSVAIGTHFWREPSLRQAASERLDQIVAEEGLDADSVEKYQQELMQLNIPMLWDLEGAPKKFFAANELATVPAILTKLTGLLLSWWGVALGAPFWYQVIRRLRATDSKKTAQTSSAEN